MMNKNAQVTLEATLLIVLAALGLLAMQGYLRRSVQGSWRTNADSFSDEQFASGASIEKVAGLSIKTTDIKVAGEGVNSQIKVASGGEKIQQIPGWGNYYGSDEEAQEEQ